MARILCVEDDETTAQEIVSELTADGFEVDWEADGREGLFKAVSGDYVAITRIEVFLDSLSDLTFVSDERFSLPRAFCGRARER